MVGSGRDGDMEHVCATSCGAAEEPVGSQSTEGLCVSAILGLCTSAEGWGRVLGSVLGAPGSLWIPDRDCSAGGLWLLAATDSALKGSQGRCGGEVVTGSTGRLSSRRQDGFRLDPGTRALRESWV